MDILKSLLPCFTDVDINPPAPPPAVSLFREKGALHYASPRSTDDTAADIISALVNAEKAGSQLDTTIQEIVAQSGGWEKYIAMKVLQTLEEVIKKGSPMNKAMGEAFDRALDFAEKIKHFAKDHPVFCTIVALGILIILAPTIIHLLGFAAEGPVAGKFKCGQPGSANLTVDTGSFAAAWQSMYGGYVESGSLFSYLQMLGMLY